MKKSEFLRLKRESEEALKNSSDWVQPNKYFRVHYRILPSYRGKTVEKSTVIVAKTAAEALDKAKEMGLRTPYLNVSKKAAFI